MARKRFQNRRKRSHSYVEDDFGFFDKARQNASKFADKRIFRIGSKRSLGTLHESSGKKKLLLAEDNLMSQRLIAHFLEKAGYEVKVVENGLDALDVLSRESFEVVLMDVQMPGMEGTEVVKHLRQGGKFPPHIPIIALTAYDLNEERENLLKAGMDECISKPVDVQHLLSTIARMSTRTSRNSSENPWQR